MKKTRLILFINSFSDDLVYRLERLLLWPYIIYEATKIHVEVPR